MTLVSATLKDCLSVIRDRTNWCRYWSARDKNGNLTDPNSPAAAQWCAVGIVARFCGADWKLEEDCMRLLRSEADKLWHCRFLPAINDSEMFGHDAIVQTFEHAIAREETLHATPVATCSDVLFAA
jgi:hypothetical protein